MINEAQIQQAVVESMRLAVQDTLAAMSTRIFIDGKNSDEGKIGNYDTKPFYANPKTSPVATNKTGKTGKKIQGGYYAGGYKEYRGQQGRESGFINQRLSGDLQSDFNNGSSGFNLNQTGELCFSISIDKPENVAKVKGQEARFGPIFTELSKSEESLLLNRLEQNITNKLKSL